MIPTVCAFGQGYRLNSGDRLDLASYRWQYLYPEKTIMHGSIRPFVRQDVFNMAMKIDSTFRDFVPDLCYALNDNNEWLDKESAMRISNKPFLGAFYKSPAFLLELDTKDFYFRINPVLHVEVLSSFGEDQKYFNNLRGLEIRGGLDQKLYFYTNILEKQARYPAYIRDWVDKYQAVPGAGFYKETTSRIFNVDKTYDFLRSSGYAGFQASKHFSLELGHGAHFIGNGIRSLFMSDFSGNYFYLKLNTRVWKIHYQNIFGELSPISARQDKGDQLLPKKYFAAHYLSYKPNDNLRFGLFETVTFDRPNQFEFQYLNPIILYRTVEQSLGSPDNVFLGVDFNWTINKRISLYGQFLLDEFSFDKFFDGSNWWGNKYGLQFGAEYFNALGVEGLDIQAEVNIVRPYTYAHRDTFANYSHFNQSLAHPLGANLREGILRLKYHGKERWNVEWTQYIMMYGEDPEGEDLNYGKNILLSNETRVMEDGVKIGQGIRNEILRSELFITYMLFYNGYLDFHAGVRILNEPINAKNTGYYAGIGFRLNIGYQRMPF